MKQKKVLILCPSPKGTAPTQRLKYEQYLILLETEGFKFEISSFQSITFWEIIYKPGNILQKILWTIWGYLKRTYDILRAPYYDIIFINLWVTPFGYPLYEYLLLKFNKNVIYDIDDMIFLNNEKRSLIDFLKGKKKPIYLMTNSKYVITCTPKLEEYAKNINIFGNVIDISSTFNTKRFVPVLKYENKSITTLGWTGTHSTLPFLMTLKPILEKIALKRNIKLLVIANKAFKMDNVVTDFKFWNEESEVRDLHEIDIGLYPIPTNEWSLGKSSLKALTYMSIAIPVVATAYGTNFRVIEDGISGYLVSSDNDWENVLISLIDNAELRKKIGLEGRRVVEKKFSLEANYHKYLNVFNTVLNQKK